MSGHQKRSVRPQGHQIHLAQRENPNFGANFNSARQHTIHREFRLTPPRYLFREYLFDVVLRDFISAQRKKHSQTTADGSPYVDNKWEIRAEKFAEQEMKNKWKDLDNGNSEED